MTLVFDTSVLSCFARAERLHLLDRLTNGRGRRVATRAVIDEIGNGIPLHPNLAEVARTSWLEQVSADGLDELKYFAKFSRRLVDQKNQNVGEASALAWTKVHMGVFLSDDQTAIDLAKEERIKCERTLRLIVNGVQQGRLYKNEVATLVDELISGGARFPCKGGSEFLSWANLQGFFD